MWNYLNKTGARGTGKSSKSLTNGGEQLDTNSGGINEDELEMPTIMGDGGATISEVNNKVYTKGEDKKGAGSSRKAVMGEKSSSKVVIENQTDKVLVLREKVRAANGIVRYSIGAGKSIVIQVGQQSTYYRLLVYAVEVDKHISTQDTGLTIDSDKLSDAPRIVVSKDGTGKYIIS